MNPVGLVRKGTEKKKREAKLVHMWSQPGGAYPTPKPSRKKKKKGKDNISKEGCESIAERSGRKTDWLTGGKKIDASPASPGASFNIVKKQDKKQGGGGEEWGGDYLKGVIERGRTYFGQQKK